MATMAELAVPYAGGTLDRASERRADSDWLAEVRGRPGSRVVPLWRDRFLVAGERRLPVSLPAADSDLMLDQTVFLGLDRDAGVFAVDLSTLDEQAAVQAAGADESQDLRAMVDRLPPAAAAELAYARGILGWSRTHRFCGACGDGTDPREGGHVRLCRGCGRMLFPRIEPAVIVLVEAPEPPRRCLLVRHRGADPGAFAAVAGFVEIGESFEDAVRREVAEEAGIAVEDVRYQASQPWPFPSGVMIGYRARATSTAAVPDGDEIEEARWFTAAELVEHRARRRRSGAPARTDSIERVLVGSWLGGES